MSNPMQRNMLLIPYIQIQQQSNPFLHWLLGDLTQTVMFQFPSTQ